MKNVRKIVLSLTAVLMIFAGSSMPAHADGPAAGAIAFSGTADLDTFQCPGGGCLGDFSGTAEGAIAGVNNGVPWTVVFSPVGFGANFSYGDTCLGVGNANGVGTIHANLGDLRGTYGPVPGVIAFPAPVLEMWINFDFTWVRVGLTAVISVTIDVILEVATPGPSSTFVAVAVNHSSGAAAVFVPTTPPSVDVCTGAATMPLSALVAGVLALD